MATQQTVPQSNRARKSKQTARTPRTYSDAIAQGFRVCEENYAGELRRKGTLKLERINKATGAVENVSVPFHAQVVPGRPCGYKLTRNVYDTPEERAAQTAAREGEKVTLRQSFDYFFQPSGRPDEKALNLERGLRAIAFLLHWQSEIGNQPVDGNVANGLAYILENAAEEVKPAPVRAS